MLIACPTCGRLQFDMDTVVAEIEQRLEAYEEPVEVAVLGCAVNGIGEASHADFGITGAKNEGLIFAHGKPLRKVPQDDLVDALFEEIDKSLDRGKVEVDESQVGRGRRVAAAHRGGERRRADAGADRRDGGCRREGRRRRRRAASDRGPGQRRQRVAAGADAARRGSLAGRGPALHADLRAAGVSLAGSMTRLSSYWLPTLREDPADAEAVSHRLMLRAGLIRQLGAGMWTFLPAGWRVHRRVEQIIREELDAIGAQEMLMPVLQPAELWKRTGRFEIPELFKLRDRKDAELVLAMTHEESLTYHVARDVRSYRELPLMLYHLQTKERDEPRPRAGVLRTREFMMKDAYSFDRDEEGLDRSYGLQIQAYDRIFDRAGLRWYRVESDVGMMGGLGAHEYMAPCAAGENEIALAPDYRGQRRDRVGRGAGR